MDLANFMWLNLVLNASQDVLLLALIVMAGFIIKLVMGNRLHVKRIEARDAKIDAFLEICEKNLALSNRNQRDLNPKINDTEMAHPPLRDQLKGQP